MFKKIRLLNLNDEAATAFVDANRLFEEIQKDIGSARGNFGVAASAVSKLGMGVLRSVYPRNFLRRRSTSRALWRGCSSSMLVAL